MIWTHTQQDLLSFTSYLNSIHPTLKFTSNHSSKSLPFLDVNFVNGIIETDLYTKPIDKHQYLLHSSCHPHHTKRAIPFSLFLKRRRICSSNETFTLRTNELKTYLNKRGYNLSFLNREFQHVRTITRAEALTPKDISTNQPSRVPLVITYNPALRSLSSIIHKHFSYPILLLPKLNIYLCKFQRPIFIHSACTINIVYYFISFKSVTIFQHPIFIHSVYIINKVCNFISFACYIFKFVKFFLLVRLYPEKERPCRSKLIG